MTPIQKHVHKLIQGAQAQRFMYHESHVNNISRYAVSSQMQVIHEHFPEKILSAFASLRETSC